MEENLQDPQKYRFPYFEEMMWYAAEHYAGLIHGAPFLCCHGSFLFQCLKYLNLFRFMKGKRTAEICEHERRGLNELAKWLKFYKVRCCRCPYFMFAKVMIYCSFIQDKKPQGDIPAAYIIDTLRAFIDNKALPNIEFYEDVRLYLCPFYQHLGRRVLICGGCSGR